MNTTNDKDEEGSSTIPRTVIVIKARKFEYRITRLVFDLGDEIK